MTRSSRPYLARALYEWLLDNELTPYLVVDATQPGVEVPRQSVQNGQIVLNASPTAIRDFFMENQAVGFSARFGGEPMQIMVPMEALLAVYARENGVGMVFGHEPDLNALEEANDDSEGDADTDEPAASLSSVAETSDKSGSGEETPEKSDEAPKKRPSLRVVK